MSMHLYKTGDDIEPDENEASDTYSYDYYFEGLKSSNEHLYTSSLNSSARALSSTVIAQDLLPTASERKEIRRTGRCDSWSNRTTQLSNAEITELFCQLSEMFDAVVDNVVEKCYWCGNDRLKKTPCAFCGRP